MKKIAAVLVTVSGLTFAGVPEGKAVFSSKCASCHGPNGEGKEAIAKMFKVEMKPLGPQSEAEIKKAVTEGTGKMKPVSGLSAAQVNDVAAFVKTLKH